MISTNTKSIQRFIFLDYFRIIASCDFAFKKNELLYLKGKFVCINSNYWANASKDYKHSLLMILVEGTLKIFLKLENIP